MRKAPEGFDFDGRTRRKEGIRDVRWLGGCDEGVRKLCELVGWGEELERLVEKGGLALDAQAEVEAGNESDVEEAEGGREGGETVVKDGEVELVKAGDDDVDSLAARVEVVTLEDGATSRKVSSL